MLSEKLRSRFANCSMREWEINSIFLLCKIPRFVLFYSRCISSQSGTSALSVHETDLVNQCKYYYEKMRLCVDAKATKGKSRRKERKSAEIMGVLLERITSMEDWSKH